MDPNDITPEQILATMQQQDQSGPLSGFVLNIVIGVLVAGLGYFFYWIFLKVGLEQIEASFVVILFFVGWSFSALNGTGYNLMTGIQTITLKVMELQGKKPNQNF
ncbi:MULTISPECIES: hypothetical protein [unclassified Nitrospina]|uniref:hypothetical protein n=1 Tax=unclassified Nitrospina TaxID=2638683 RepID=UPI003F97AAFC